MSVEHIRAIWRKEMLETLRDKRTLYMMVLMPLVIMPLLVLAGPVMMERQFRQGAEIPAKVLWIGRKHRKISQRCLLRRMALNGWPNRA